MHSLAVLNALDRDGFVAALGEVFEHSPWVAQRVHRRGVEYRGLARKAPRADVYAIQRHGENSPVIRGFLDKAKVSLALRT